MIDKNAQNAQPEMEQRRKSSTSQQEPDSWHSKNYEDTFGLSSLDDIVKENDEVDKNIEALTRKQEQLTNSLTDDQGKMDVIEAGTCHRLQPQFIPASLLMVMSEMDNAQI